MSDSTLKTSGLRHGFARLHHDESGPNTVEWALLAVVGLIVILGVLKFATFVSDTFGEKSGKVTQSIDMFGSLSEESTNYGGTVPSTEVWMDSGTKAPKPTSGGGNASPAPTAEPTSPGNGWTYPGMGGAPSPSHGGFGDLH